ncbi:GNAT family N-acetyltransferase [Aeromonas caviae]|uniref:GNAT family N-acetyltransferase n=1 Tax=Aeromonas caviae TaxID=648 RepID=UPI0022856B42
MPAACCKVRHATRATRERREGMQIRLDDVTDPRVMALLEEHLNDMRAISPPESTHALDGAALRAPDVSFWTLWDGEEAAGCVALKRLEAGHGEIKSMRTAARYRRRGIARQLLAHVLEEAHLRGLTRLSLETGSQPFFAPAHHLYHAFGFEECGPFGHYREDPYSRFMTKAL